MGNNALSMSLKPNDNNNNNNDNNNNDNNNDVLKNENINGSSSVNNNNNNNNDIYIDINNNNNNNNKSIDNDIDENSIDSESELTESEVSFDENDDNSPRPTQASTVVIARSIATEENQRRLMGSEIDHMKKHRGYPIELDQSDEFKTLLTGGQEVHPNFEFMTTNAMILDQYVRQTMYILLKWLGTLIKSNNRTSSRSGHRVTMVDLSLYCRYFPKEYQQAYTLRVERILNSNGLSLQMGARHEFDPHNLAALFQPVFRPTIHKCNCNNIVCDEQTSADPTSDLFCTCYIAGRGCTDACSCRPTCKLRDNPHYDLSSRSRVEISGARNASMLLNPALQRDKSVHPDMLLSPSN